MRSSSRACFRSALATQVRERAGALRRAGRRSRISRPTTRDAARRRSALRSSVAVLGAADELQRRHAGAPGRRRRPRRTARRAGRSRPSTSRCRGRGSDAGGGRARRRRSSRRARCGAARRRSARPTPTRRPRAPRRRLELRRVAGSSSAVSWSIAAGSSAASAGTRGSLDAPVAATTASHVPRARVGHARRSRPACGRTAVDGRRCVSTGASIPPAVAVEERRRRLRRGHEAVGIVAAGSGDPGSAVIQFGVSSRSESHRSVRHEFATSPRSSTTWSIAGRGEVMAHRESGRAGTDDHDGHAACPLLRRRSRALRRARPGRSSGS